MLFPSVRVSFFTFSFSVYSSRLFSSFLFASLKLLGPNPQLVMQISHDAVRQCVGGGDDVAALFHHWKLMSRRRGQTDISVLPVSTDARV